MSVQSTVRPSSSPVPAVPGGTPAVAVRHAAVPTQPRVLQSARAPGQMSFVFHR